MGPKSSREDQNYANRRRDKIQALNRLFCTFDKEKKKKKDGSIARDEFVSFLADIETGDEKISLLFDLYDISGDGKLDRQVIDVVLKAMVREGVIKLHQVKVLGDAFFSAALKASGSEDGVDGKITRVGFKKLLLQSHSLSSDVSMLIEHWIGALENALKPKDESKEQKEEEERTIDMATQARAKPTFCSFSGLNVLLIVVTMVAVAILHRKSKGLHDDLARYGFPLHWICLAVYVCMLQELVYTLEEFWRGASAANGLQPPLST